MSVPCSTSFAWTSTLIGGFSIHDDDLAASMVLFFILLIFVAIGSLRVYHGRHLRKVLLIFLPTLAFATCFTIWSALRAHLSNLSHSSVNFVQTQPGLSELVATNGLVTCAPMLLCDTAFQVFGLLAKRVVFTARKPVKYTAYAARLANLVALIMTVVNACILASYLAAWLDQSRLAPVQSHNDIQGCITTTLGGGLTLLPLLADGLELVVLFALSALTVLLGLRLRVASGVVVHVCSIQLCLVLHYAWKCVRDWSAFQLYLYGDWNRSSELFALNIGMESLAKRIRKGAEDPTLFYLLGVVPLVLAMILIYTLNLTSYTNPTPAISATQGDLPTRFRLVLDPSSPHIELLPTSNSPTSTAAPSDSKGKGKKDAGNDKGRGAGTNSVTETYVVKMGWLGGWSVSPAQQEQGWTGQLKKRVQRWVMGWSSEQKAVAIAV